MYFLLCVCVCVCACLCVCVCVCVFAEELREHFGKFGEIESVNVKTDPQTGRSRGFAFIVYTSSDAIEKVTAAGEHVINNKKVDPKKAKARHGKIFVGGLTADISDEEIKIFFSQFGTVSVRLLCPAKMPTILFIE